MATKAIMQVKSQSPQPHITRCLASNSEILKSRANFIVRHFNKEIKRKYKSSSFSPKAMLVTSSRINILRYKSIIEDFISELPPDEQFEVVVAFSPFSHQGEIYYEEDVNVKYGIHFLREFQTLKSSVSLIIVHSKYLLSFDEPLLHTM